MNKYLEKLASSNSGIDIKKSHKGLLHKALGVKKGDKISPSELASAKSRAEKSGNSKLVKEVTFAQNAKKWNHE